MDCSCTWPLGTHALLSVVRIHECARAGDVAGLEQELGAGVSIEARDPGTDLTPLAAAATSRDDTHEVLRLLLARGADPNAECGTKRKTSTLLLSVSLWDPIRLRLLLEAGADITYRTESGYDVLLSCFYVKGASHDPRLLDTVRFLIASGSPLESVTEYGETALNTASKFGRFDAIDLMLEAGADPTPLRWAALHRAAALGSLEDVKELASEGDLEEQDRWARTPWLLCAVAGDLNKAKCLASSGSDQAARDRFKKDAVAHAIERDHEELFAWLVSEGSQLQNETSRDSALRLAAGEGRAAMVKRLLAAGADPLARDEKGHSPMRAAATLEVRRTLKEAGGDPDDIGKAIRQALTGLKPKSLACSPEEFHVGRDRRFGTANPERMDVPFWRAMVAARTYSWAARRLFIPKVKPSKPVWCYSRYGQSITELEDGRVVEVGGEHEDFYDPDFCIYNDVVVYDGEGGFTIYGYPKDVFPPTDFQSATPFEGWIYLIGSVGYLGERDLGRAQVYRLSTDDFHIERVETSGDDPGWIGRHLARLRPPASVLVSRGTLCTSEGREDSERGYVFDLRSHAWSLLGE